ncbi:hypothetical protein SME38J_08990 [Serratia marcescens]|nr:hypothetical protein SME38J_08990 [Serratia marcescens]
MQTYPAVLHLMCGKAGVAHCLHFLDVSHAQCLSRITLRNAPRRAPVYTERSGV